jgi:hypothetical protein
MKWTEKKKVGRWAERGQGMRRRKKNEREREEKKE